MEKKSIVFGGETERLSPPRRAQRAAGEAPAHTEPLEHGAPSDLSSSARYGTLRAAPFVAVGMHPWHISRLQMSLYLAQIDAPMSWRHDVTLRQRYSHPWDSTVAGNTHECVSGICHVEHCAASVWPRRPLSLGSTPLHLAKSRSGQYHAHGVRTACCHHVCGVLVK